MRPEPIIVAICLGSAAIADTRSVYLEPLTGARIKIAEVTVEANQDYRVTMDEAAFEDHFLSMRPFRCLEGDSKHWCHVPYPYQIARNITADLVDLEYDFLFLWKKSTDYGINMWNGIYYKLEPDEAGRIVGVLHEMDMDLLSAPPEPGVLRPLKPGDLHQSDADSHWLPRMIIE